MICPVCKADTKDGAKQCGYDGGPLEGAAGFCPFFGTRLVADSVQTSLIGQVLGDRYLVTDKLGQGTVGTVYRATDQRSGQAVALKVLNPEFGPDAPPTRAAINDSLAATRLGHPNLVPTLDSAVHQDRFAFGIEPLLTENALAARLEAGPISPAEAVRIAQDVSSGLEALHGAGVLHLAVKPDNIFSIRDPLGMERAVLTGIGLRHLLHLDQAPSRADGECLAQPEYLAPEIVGGKPLDERTDIYQVGLLLYEMLTGRPPFTGGTFKTVSRRHALEKPIGPQLVRPEARMGDPLGAVVMRCLEKAPTRRYADMKALRAALEAVASDGLEGAAGARFPSASLPPRQASSPLPSLSSPAAAPRMASAPAGLPALSSGTIPAVARLSEAPRPVSAPPVTSDEPADIDMGATVVGMAALSLPTQEMSAKPEPVAAEAKAEPEPAAAAPKAEPKPEPVAAAPKAEPKPEPVATEPKPEPKPEPVVPEAKPEPEPTSDPSDEDDGDDDDANTASAGSTGANAAVGSKRGKKGKKGKKGRTSEVATTAPVEKPQAAGAASVSVAKVQPASGPSVIVAKNEPATVSVTKAEPAKTEPAKTEPAKAEPAKAEPAKTEPAKAGKGRPSGSANKAVSTAKTEGGKAGGDPEDDDWFVDTPDQLEAHQARLSVYQVEEEKERSLFPFVLGGVAVIMAGLLVLFLMRDKPEDTGGKKDKDTVAAKAPASVPRSAATPTTAAPRPDAAVVAPVVDAAPAAEAEDAGPADADGGVEDAAVEAADADKSAADKAAADKAAADKAAADLAASEQAAADKAAADKAAADKAAADLAAADKAAADKAAADKAAADQAAAALAAASAAERVALERAAADKAAADKAAADKAAADKAAADKAAANKPTADNKAAAKAAAAKAAADRAAAAKAAAAANQAASKARLAEGQTALNRGDWTAAERAFREVIAFDRSNAAAYAGLGDAAFQQQKFADAVKHRQACVKLSPRNANYLLDLGMAHFKADNYPEARKVWENVLKVSPGNAKATKYLGILDRKQGK